MEAIHNFATEHGSKLKIQLVIAKTFENTVVYCTKGYSNHDYTKGYSALLYYAQCLLKESAYVSVNSNAWFHLTITNIKEFLEEIE